MGQGREGCAVFPFSAPIRFRFCAPFFLGLCIGGVHFPDEGLARMRAYRRAENAFFAYKGKITNGQIIARKKELVQRRLGRNDLGGQAAGKGLTARVGGPAGRASTGRPWVGG